MKDDIFEVYFSMSLVSYSWSFDFNVWVLIQNFLSLNSLILYLEQQKKITFYNMKQYIKSTVE